MDEATARRKYGQVVALRLGESELLFRPLAPSDAKAAADEVLDSPAGAYDVSIRTCEQQCLTPEGFRDLVERHPLAFSGQSGVFGKLLELAQIQTVARVKDGAKLWKSADRNPGRMAENLLAFKAYSGGDYNAQEFAGALTVAEWMGSTKGLFQLVLSLLKSLSRRK